MESEKPDNNPLFRRRYDREGELDKQIEKGNRTSREGERMKKAGQGKKIDSISEQTKD